MSGMKYVRMEWKHNLDDSPTIYFLEIGENDYVTREVELHRNYSICFTDGKAEYGTLLAPTLFEGIDECNYSTVYESMTAKYVSQEDFENNWNKAFAPDFTEEQ